MKHEITEEAILKAANECPDTKKVLEILFPDAFKNEVDEYKIYAFNGSGDKIYKLQRIGKSWAFCDLRTSVCMADGSYDSIQQALSGRENVKVFSTRKDFFKWALEQVS